MRSDAGKTQCDVRREAWDSIYFVLIIIISMYREREREFVLGVRVGVRVCSSYCAQHREVTTGVKPINISCLDELIRKKGWIGRGRRTCFMVTNRTAALLAKDQGENSTRQSVM